MIRKKLIRTSLIKPFFLLLMLLACNVGPNDVPITTAFFDDITIALDFPQYLNLQHDGGFVEINDRNAGIRGIILYRYNSNTYFAYERNCSYKPNSACATVDVHLSGLFMIDNCCGSTFSFSTGFPSGGPAWRPLRKYRTLLQGHQLIIQDQVVQ